MADLNMLKNFRVGGKKLVAVGNLKHTIFYFRPGKLPYS